MADEIVNPFKHVKKVDWAKKAQDKLKEREKEPKNEAVKPQKKAIKTSSNKVKRIPKSFKIYPGNISRSFDKRVNRLQVKFDELDFEKDYVDSGKYIMFLMVFAEKYGLYDLYTQIDSEGNFEVDKKKLKAFAEKLK